MLRISVLFVARGHIELILHETLQEDLQLKYVVQPFFNPPLWQNDGSIHISTLLIIIFKNEFSTPHRSTPVVKSARCNYFFVTLKRDRRDFIVSQTSLTSFTFAAVQRLRFDFN